MVKNKAAMVTVIRKMIELAQSNVFRGKPGGPQIWETEFIAFTRAGTVLQPLDRSGIERLQGLTMSVDDPVSAIIEGRTLPTELPWDERFSSIKSWISNCRSNHEKCVGRAVAPLPKRVIDVGTRSSSILIMFLTIAIALTTHV